MSAHKEKYFAFTPRGVHLRPPTQEMIRSNCHQNLVLLPKTIMSVMPHTAHPPSVPSEKADLHKETTQSQKVKKQHGSIKVKTKMPLMMSMSCEECQEGTANEEVW